MRNRYYKWLGCDGSYYWFNVGVHKYLIKGGINIRYMKMDCWSGETCLMTKKEYLATKGF